VRRWPWLEAAVRGGLLSRSRRLHNLRRLRPPSNSVTMAAAGLVSLPLHPSPTHPNHACADAPLAMSRPSTEKHSLAPSHAAHPPHRRWRGRYRMHHPHPRRTRSPHRDAARHQVSPVPPGTGVCRGRCGYTCRWPRVLWLSCEHYRDRFPSEVDRAVHSVATLAASLLSQRRPLRLMRGRVHPKRACTGTEGRAFPFGGGSDLRAVPLTTHSASHTRTDHVCRPSPRWHWVSCSCSDAETSLVDGARSTHT
jgi:hypothetical protein